MPLDIKEIISRFAIEGTYQWHEPFGEGHIHDTYRVETAGGGANYLLQRINTGVFPDVMALQENIFRITAHLKQKLERMPGRDPSRERLTPIPLHTGALWHEDTGGNCWRMFLFIENHRSYQRVETPSLAFEGGRAIGRFQALMSDLPGPPLKETIPDFHNVRSRIELLRMAMEENAAGRRREVRAETDFALERENIMKTIERLGAQGAIPRRITHNDTKFNNILLDENDRALCLIDLDTVMPGYVHYDFGDAIRTGASTAAEDEKDLEKIGLNMEVFQAYAKGYLQEAGNMLVPKELEYLAFAPLLMTYIMGIRFLTDYLRGDTYYKTGYTEHNLIRTRAQFTLIQMLEEEKSFLQGVINHCL